MSDKPEEMTTYRPPDGEPLRYPFDEVGWVTELEWFEDDDEPRRLRRQRWVCVEDVVGTYTPPGCVTECGACKGTGSRAPGFSCARCDGEGVISLTEGFAEDPS